jgi:hypothetical protein
MAVVLLALVLLVALVLIPFGLPGTWIMLAAAVGYNVLTRGAILGRIGLATLIGTGLLAVVAEVLEFALAARYTRRFGGSRRASWGAIIGGMIGAFVGLPVPIVGSIIGAFAGAFLGAFAAELTNRTGTGAATRVATGALLGRAAGAATKIGFGLAIAAWLIAAAAL